MLNAALFKSIFQHMETIECKVCNKQVDKAAKFCPECGAAFAVQGGTPAALKSKPAPLKEIAIVVGVVAVITFGYFLFSTPQPVPQPPNKGQFSMKGHEDIGEMGAALENLPADYNGLVTSGDQYMNQNNFPIAAECYKRALAIDSSSPDVRSDFASCLYGMGLVDRALEEFRGVRNDYPLHSVSLFNLGVVFYTQNESDSAKYYFTEYLELSPDGQAAQQAKDFLNELGI